MNESEMSFPPGEPLMAKGTLIFYLCFLAWLLTNAIIFMKWPQSESFLWIDHERSFVEDILFTGLTYLGNGFTVVFLGILCIWRGKRDIGIGLIFSYILSGIITLCIKHYFNLPRPEAFFTNHSLVKTASWITLYYKHSFPSGHATTIFAAAATICLFLPEKRYVAAICFTTACLTAYSRVYLGEHFLEDIWVGSLVGVTCATFCFLIQPKTSSLKKEIHSRLKGVSKMNVKHQ